MFVQTVNDFSLTNQDIKTTLSVPYTFYNTEFCLESIDVFLLRTIFIEILEGSTTIYIFRSD